MRWWGDGVVCSRFVHVLVSNHWGVLILIISCVYVCFVSMAWWNSLCSLVRCENCFSRWRSEVRRSTVSEVVGEVMR